MKFLLVFLFSPLMLMAQSSSVDEATEAMKDQAYDKAIGLYLDLINDGQSSPELHYNLGLAFAQKQQIGYALWHFHIAEKKGLNSEALQHNITLMQEQRVDEIEVVQEFFLKRWFNSWKSIFSPNLWALFALLSIILGVYGLLKWQRGEERKIRKKGFILGFVGVTLSLICLLTGVSAAKDISDPSSGILLSKTYELKAAPDAESASILDIHEGIDLEIKDEIGDWSKVRLLNGQEGWVLTNDIGLF